MKHKIEGYRGYWTIEDSHYYKGEKMYFMEHEFYGDETCYLICKEVGLKLVAIAETHDNFLETLANINDYLI